MDTSLFSAPSSIDDKVIEIYARTNLIWIKKQIEKVSTSGKKH